MRIIHGLILIICHLPLIAQKVHINSIDLIGLNHTKPIVIFRELDIAIGDSVSVTTLATVLKLNEQRVLSTGLFNKADFNISQWDELNNNVDLKLTVDELWYLYPAFIFELADRNFNVWWKEMNRDFSRVNYGARLDHLNFTGRKDKLKLKYQIGYTKKYEIDYKLPYVKKNWGLGYNIFFSENKELGYVTKGNKILFKKYDNEDVLLKKFRTAVFLSQRISGLSQHYFKTEYHYNSIDAKVVSELNPSYFPNGSDHLQYLKIEYGYQYDKTLFPKYPEGGHGFEIIATKEGLGFGNYNNASIALEVQKHFKFNKRLFLTTNVKGKTNLTNNLVPYSNNNALGYGKDYIRGYELYVIDGTRYFWAKAALKFKALDKVFNLGKFMPLRAMRNFPLRCFFRFNFEKGYSYEPTYIESNFLNNKWLTGYGPSLDLLMYNNFQFSIEYSTNHIGESGIFYKSSFGF